MSVQVKLTLFGQLRTLVDAPAQTVEMPDDSTVMDLFQVLCDRNGERFRQRVMEDRHGRPALQHHVLVFLNDEKIEGQAQATTRLRHEGDQTEVQVFLVQPFTGG